MSASSALPDHEVVPTLLPASLDTDLNDGAAVRGITESPGVPLVAIDPFDGGKVFRADIADHPRRERQIAYTAEHLAESGTIKNAFTSDFDVLRDDAAAADGIPPGGLIFHISRCGSPLRAKALVRLDSNVAINQSGLLRRGFSRTHAHPIYRSTYARYGVGRRELE